jgi:membrane protein implicated in regulation of membrane protease activity
MDALIPFMPWIWVAIIVITIIWELSTFDLNCLWFTIAATAALVISFFPDVFSPVIQLVVFAFMSLVLFFTLKKWTQKAMTVPDTHLNADALVGKEVTVETKVDAGGIGTTKVNGVVWSIVFADKETEAEVGETVVVVEIKGNKLVVKKDN